MSLRVSDGTISTENPRRGWKRFHWQVVHPRLLPNFESPPSGSAVCKAALARRIQVTSIRYALQRPVQPHVVQYDRQLLGNTLQNSKGTLPGVGCQSQPHYPMSPYPDPPPPRLCY